MTLLLVLVLFLMPVAAARAAESDPVSVPPGAPAVSAQSRFNDGLALAKKNDWAGAERAYRDALRLDPAMPEGWNGLGFALRAVYAPLQPLDALGACRNIEERHGFAGALPSAWSEYRGAPRPCRGAAERLGGLGGPSRPPIQLDARELAQAIDKAARR